MTYQEKINTLTEPQKDLYDFLIDWHDKVTGGEPTTQQEIKLIDFISEFTMLNGSMIDVYTGKVITDPQVKHFVWFKENFGMLEEIFDL